MSFVSAVATVSASPVIVTARFGLCRYVSKSWSRSLTGYCVYIRVGINFYLARCYLASTMETLHVLNSLAHTHTLAPEIEKNNEKEQRTVQKVETWRAKEKCRGTRISTYRDIVCLLTSYYSGMLPRHGQAHTATSKLYETKLPQ